MKLRSLAIAALAVVTLASCSKDGEKPDGTDPGFESGTAEVKLTLTLPQAVKSRATEDATTEESDVNSLDVYIFKADGSLPAKGAYTNITTGGFSQNNTGVYTLANKIETTAGDKIIYIAANLPATVAGAVANEADLLKKVADVHDDLLKYNAGTLVDLVMFAKAEEFLVDTEVGENEIDVEMDRAMSRVTTTYSGNAASGSVTVTGYTTGVNLTYNLKKYFVVQDAYMSFLAPNYYADGTPKSLIGEYSFADRDQIVNLYDKDDYLGASPAKTIPYVTLYSDPGAGNRAAGDGFYIGENIVTRLNKLAQYGSATYAYIQTTVDVPSTARVNSTNDGVEWVAGVGNTITGGTNDLHVIKVDGGNLAGTYLASDDNVDDLYQFLVDEGSANSVNRYIYYSAYVYFRVYLNATGQTGTDKYNVYRNHFVNIDVRDVKASFEDGFGGYPGDETDPEVPIDPNTPDPNNPDPTDPTDPIDENDANLQVNITVNPWQYVSNPTTLE